MRGDKIIALGANCPTPTALIENWPVAKGPILEYLEKAPSKRSSRFLEDEVDWRRFPVLPSSSASD